MGRKGVRQRGGGEEEAQMRGGGRGKWCRQGEGGWGGGVGRGISSGEGCWPQGSPSDCGVSAGGLG